MRDNHFFYKRTCHPVGNIHNDFRRYMDYKTKNWIVYILLCKDSTFYTGISNNMNRRLLEHEKGNGAKYTRGRGPFKIIYKAFFNTASDASKEEYRIKRLSKAQKIKLTENYLKFNK